MKNVVPLDYISKKIDSIKTLKNNIIEVGYSKYPHKYYVKFKNGSVVKFGHQDYEDTLLRKYKNVNKQLIEGRRRLYRQRHFNQKNNSIYTPGYLSYYILW